MLFEERYFWCSVPCQLGYSPVCNSRQNTLNTTALCPAVREEEEEEECSCLPRRLIEEDLRSGVNPLGLESEECVQLPSDIIYNNLPNINIGEWRDRKHKHHLATVVISQLGGLEYLRVRHSHSQDTR